MVTKITRVFASCVLLVSSQTAAADNIPVLGSKPFIAYFRPIPVHAPLSNTAWGVATVGPRDQRNGLEDPAMTWWNYWDGQILKGPDGKYRMFASRWEQAGGHEKWWESKAVQAVADCPLGPYRDTGLMWPNNEGGKGHNVTALKLPDGRYATIISETRPGSVFVSNRIDGPWSYLGPIEVDQSRYHSLQDPGDPSPLTGPDPKPFRASNTAIIARPDGGFQIIQRGGQILISRSGVTGPYRVMGDSIYRNLPGMPQKDLGRLEDPMLWYSGGWYHVVVNHWDDRRAYHLISRDGITGWRFQGLAYEPGASFIRYTNGVVNRWTKLERPGVLIENGHVTAISMAVIDVQKEQQTGNNGHGSKIVVIPFDGAAMDRDLANVDRPAKR